MAGILRALTILALQGLLVGQALAADVVAYGGYAQPYCSGHEAPSLLAEQSIAALKSEVARLKDEAVAISNDQRWIHSGRPVFVWANEAKYSCGKAYGYLKTSYRDEQNLNNCGCAYSRMRGYMD